MKKFISFKMVLLMLVAITLSITSCNKILKMVSVKTLDVESLKSTSVILRGQIANDGGGVITERGFFLSHSKSLANATEYKCGEGGIGSFEATVSGLEPNKKYYYQAYALSEDDIDVGEIKEFTTFELKLKINIEEPIVNSAEDVVFNASYENQETFQITFVGFEYSKYGDFSNGETYVTKADGTSFSAHVELDEMSNYYCRAFVMTDIQSYYYSEAVAFATYQDDGPTVTTNNADEISADHARLSGFIQTDYPGDVTMRGFYISTSATFDTKTDLWAGGGKGLYVMSADNLQPNTTYYFKAYAKFGNGAGENHGGVRSFTTANN